MNVNKIISIINEKFQSKSIPSKLICELYNKSKLEHNILLSSFIKSLNNRQETLVITSEDMDKIISEAVNDVIDKMKEQSLAGAAGPTALPLGKQNKPLDDEDEISEITTTNSGTTGYNVPGAFARKGGSKSGVRGSEKLGYTLTPIGKKDMDLNGDNLYEHIKSKKCSMDLHNWSDLQFSNNLIKENINSPVLYKQCNECKKIKIVYYC